MTDRECDVLWKEYFYPGTNVLINNLDIKDREHLKEIESTFTFERLLELQKSPIDIGYGKDNLNKIHEYLFEDIYPFAGKYRKVNMLKERGAFLFIDRPEEIDVALDDLFKETDEMLMYSHDRMSFCEVLGRLYTGLIYIHPYREGNGRTIREFVREYSLKKSKELGLGELELDWSKIDKEELNECIEVSHLFPATTSILFNKALVIKEVNKRF